MRSTTYPQEPFAAELVTTAGGAATETLSIGGVEVGDVCFVSINTEGAVAVSVVAAKCVAGGVEVEFSADPSSDHVVNVAVFKAN